MASYIVVFNSDDRMPGSMGPYTPMEAQRIKDRLGDEAIIIPNLTEDRAAANQKIREILIKDYGPKLGARNLKRLELRVK